jgi:serine/threonine-protein kinase RsbW
MDSIKIQIPSITENIRIVESFIDNAKERFSISDDLYGNIMIAITESVNNAIIHGNKLDSKKSVHLSLDIKENILSFMVEDEGNGFNYDELNDPTKLENIETPGGRGVFLMRQLSDDVRFFDNGRKVLISFYMNN